jgi:hypothetical protein
VGSPPKDLMLERIDNMEMVQIVTYTGNISFKSEDNEYEENRTIKYLKRKTCLTSKNVSIRIEFEARYHGLMFDYEISLRNIQNMWLGTCQITPNPDFCEGDGIKNVLVSEKNGNLEIFADWVECSDVYKTKITAKEIKNETFDLDNL